jgi:pSer/pThr/pTyr-binding forkhead associated (FHA) protein
MAQRRSKGKARRSERRSKNAAGRKRGPRVAGPYGDEEINSALTRPLDLDGLYVDDAQSESLYVGKEGGSPKRGKRASQRRKEQGRAPEMEAALGKDTQTLAREPSAPKSRARRDSGDVGAISDGAEDLSFALGVLTCVKGPEEGLALHLVDGSYNVGRARENHFVLKDIAASRIHIRLEARDDAVTLVDLGSGNGTKLNGKRVAESVLKNGDRIQIGNSVLLFTSGTKPHKAEVLPPISENSDPDMATSERIERAAAALIADLEVKKGAPPGASIDPDAPTAGLRGPEKPPEPYWESKSEQRPLNEVAPQNQALKNAPPMDSQRSPAPPTPPRPPQMDPRAASFVPSVPEGSSPYIVPPPPPRSSGIGALFSAILVAVVVAVLVGGGVFAAYRYILTPKGPSAQELELAFNQHIARGTLALLEEKGIDEAIKAYTQAKTIAPATDEAAGKLRQMSDGIIALAFKQADDFAAGDAVKKGHDILEDLKTNLPLEDKKRLALIQQIADWKSRHPLPDAPAEKAKGEEAKTADQLAAEKAAAEKAAAEKAAAEKAAAEKAAAKKAQPPPPKATPKKVVKKKSRKKRKPKRRAPRGMTEGQAKDKFYQAIQYLRDYETARACPILNDVARNAPEGSPWKEKAATRSARSCR